MLQHSRPLGIRDIGCLRKRAKTTNRREGNLYMLRQLSIGLVIVGAFIAVYPAPAAVADAPTDQPATLEAVVITGTRIRAPNLASESPVTAVSDEEIKNEGATNIENVLDDLPQFHTGQSNTTSNNATGVANLNLRGLGPTRTLVLIDGRRLGPGDPQGAQGAAADVNFIPAALVTGVDVLTGGASAVYGSDAIAGVVNFHLIRDFDGVQITQTFNEAQHTQSGTLDPVLQAAPYPIPVAIPGNQLDGLVSDSTLVVAPIPRT